MVVKFWALCNWVLACVFIWMKSETVWTVEITKCFWLVYVIFIWFIRFLILFDIHLLEN